MRKILSSLAVVLACGLVVAEDAAPTRQELEKKKKELQASIAALRDEIAASDALAGARKKVAEAKADYDKKLAKDQGVAKAKMALSDAQAALEALIRAKTAGSPEIADVATQRKQLEAQRRAALFQIGLAELQIEHPGSPLCREIEKDSDVRKAREALAAAERELARDPSATVQEARAKVAAAQAALEPIQAKVNADDKLQKIREKLRKEDKTGRGAGQPRDTTVADARKALDEARAAAYAGIEAAKPFLQDAAGAEEELKQLTAQKKALLYVLTLIRADLRATGDGAISAARAKYEAAKAALDQAAAGDEFAANRKPYEAACKAYDECFNKLIGPNAAYKELTAKLDGIKEQLAKAEAAAVKSGSAKEIENLASQIAALREQAQAAEMARREIRMKEQELDRCYWARANAHRALEQQIRGSAVKQAVDAAEDVLDAAVEEKVRDAKAGKTVYKALDELNPKISAVEYRLAVARYNLYDRNSEIAAQAEGQAAVGAKRDALAQADADARAKAPKKDEKTLALEAEEKALLAAAQEAAGQPAAANAVRAAEGAFRKAQLEDPKKLAVDKAREAVQTARNARLAKLDDGKQAAATLKASQAVIDEHDKKARELAQKANGVQRKVETADDPEVKAAKERVAAAQQAVKDAQNSADLQKAKAKIAEAEAGIPEKLNQLLEDNKEYKILKKQIDDLEAQIKALAQPARKKAEPKKGEGKKADPAAKKDMKD